MLQNVLGTFLYYTQVKSNWKGFRNIRKVEKYCSSWLLSFFNLIFPPPCSLLNFTSMNVLRNRKHAGLPPPPLLQENVFLPLFSFLSFTQYKKYERLWPIAHFLPSFIQWFSTSFYTRVLKQVGCIWPAKGVSAAREWKTRNVQLWPNFKLNSAYFFTLWPAEPFLFKTASHGDFFDPYVAN